MEAKRKAAFDKRRSELVEAWEQESAKRELEEDDIQAFEEEQRHPSATGRRHLFVGGGKRRKLNLKEEDGSSSDDESSSDEDSDPPSLIFRDPCEVYPYGSMECTGCGLCWDGNAQHMCVFFP